MVILVCVSGNISFAFLEKNAPVFCQWQYFIHICIYILFLITSGQLTVMLYLIFGLCLMPIVSQHLALEFPAMTIPTTLYKYDFHGKSSPVM